MPTNDRTQPPSDEIMGKVVAEEWRPVDQYEGYYEVSSEGRIRSVDRYVNAPRGRRISRGKVLKSAGTRYLSLELCKNGESRQVSVHRIVAEAFLDNPNNYPVVHHINHDPKDNRAKNLEWCTQSQNINHARDAGRIGNPSETHATKLDRGKVRQIRRNASCGMKYREIAREYCISEAYVSEIVTRKKWKNTQ